MSERATIHSLPTPEIVGRHIAPDACDTIARRDSGYGPGVYLPDRVPSQPHAGCLCQQVIVDLRTP